MKLLIDGDILVYRAGHACEERYFQHPEDEEAAWNTKKEAKEAGLDKGEMQSLILVQVPKPESIVVACVKNMVTKMVKATRADSFEILLTDTNIHNNFRYQLDSEYKANRKSTKPLRYEFVRSILVQRYCASVVSGYEADDELGIRQTDDTIIASIDKDLWMIPGYHYDIGTGAMFRASDPGELTVTALPSGVKKLVGHGFKWFCAQMLLGDAVDNIKGIKGMGPVSVIKALADCKTCSESWKVVESIYKKKEQLDRIDRTAGLLWIHRDKHREWNRDIPGVLDGE